MTKAEHSKARAGWFGGVRRWEGWGSAGALAETGEGINSFKRLGYSNRL